MNHLHTQEIVKTIEQCTLSATKKVSAMLDLDSAQLTMGMPLPKGWHFFLFSGDTRKSLLRSDGFPGLGLAIPDLGLPRLLLGGRTIRFHKNIHIGEELERSSFIKSIVQKTGNYGPLALVTLQHELKSISDKELAITETQTYVLLSGKSETPIIENKNNPTILERYQKQVIPDQTLLFQYSALGFNSHKIHLDRYYTQNIEMLPDLVVNGGLANILITEFVRMDHKLEIEFIKTKHLSPLYCDRLLTIATDQIGKNMLIKIYDNQNKPAVEAEVTLK